VTSNGIDAVIKSHYGKYGGSSKNEIKNYHMIQQ
jgi:hypothetical protein